VSRQGRHVVLDIHANAFLHHMVRNIAGVLIPIGQGKRDAEWVREVMEARDRRASGITAPAGGLYLVGVDYDPAFGLPQAGQQPVWPIVPATPPGAGS
jgi:tRNA pseudouridine38-40 synthase